MGTKPRNKSRKTFVRVLKGIGIFLLLIILFAGILAADLFTGKEGSNPYSAILLDDDMERSLSSIRRLDGDGYLYYMEYYGDYSKDIIKLPIEKLGFLKETGCSASATTNENGDKICCRNYHLAHKDGNGMMTGLNVIVMCEPENGYRSLCISDAMWLSMIGLSYSAGALDDGKTNLTPLVLIPYLCVDGMNEKGLTLSILSVDVKDGETAVSQSEEGKPSMVYPLYMRKALDNCATVDEAVALAENTNFLNTFGYDYHVFITDAAGKCAVIECRYNQLKVTYTDAVTNSYVGFDDAGDCCWDGQLKERFNGLEKTEREYSAGYGHGYARFNKIIGFLDRHSAEISGVYRTTATEDEAVDVLRDVSQEYTGDLTSNTQYSVIYNSDELSATVYPMRDYSVPYIIEIDTVNTSA